VFSRFNFIGARVERSFAGALPATVRQNMLIELWGSIAFGVFFATAIQFIPVVLRRLGASSDLLALYTAQTYLGSILTSFSLVLMRRRRTKTFAVACWFFSRSLFLLFAFVTRVPWLLLVMAIFWVVEGFPSPAYTRIVQAIYPENIRGKAMAVVRLGMVCTTLLMTPLAGWALDHWSYRVLFPLGSVIGLLSVWLFNKLHVDEGVLPPRNPRPVGNLWRIVQQNRPFAIHLLAFAVYGLGALLGYALYPIVQVDRLHLSYTAIGLLGLAQSSAWLLGFIFWGRAIDRLGGLPVMRANLAVGFFVPLAYIWASSGWMLLPAFIAQGIISAGVDLALISTCIQLAEPDKVVEYAAIQATVIGTRGMIAPFIGIGLLKLGLPDTGIFALGCMLIVISWFILGQIPTVAGAPKLTQRQALRWPWRFRFPRI